MMFKKLLDILVCPVPECRKPLTLSADEESLACTGCGRVYPVRDGIPILLVDQAQMPGQNKTS
ncbi:MAG TPA: Trm112 family protein [Candidatus Angelobacter sp.]|nr:Trm112 family protein [Candidatus Angelobacter sp.]